MNISRQGMGQAALLLIAGTVLSRPLGFIRETIIAYQFGASAETDAYLVASIIPMALSGILAGGITAAFIPVFTEHRLKTGEEEAWAIASAVINLAALFLVAGTVLYLLAAPFLVPLLGPGLATETKALAVHLSRLLAPAIIFTGLVGLAAAVLNAYPALWLFVTQEGVEPTNSAAERAIRPAVIWRRISFGSQSAAGSEFVARMLSVVTTLKQQDRDVLAYLTEACQAARQGKAAPSLLPSVAELEDQLPIAA